jgi:hypothetical protein
MGMTVKQTCVCGKQALGALVLRIRASGYELQSNQLCPGGTRAFVNCATTTVRALALECGLPGFSGPNCWLGIERMTPHSRRMPHSSIICGTAFECIVGSRNKQYRHSMVLSGAGTDGVLLYDARGINQRLMALRQSCCRTTTGAGPRKVSDEAKDG